MSKRSIIIHLDSAAETAITSVDLFAHVSRLDADHITVVGTPSQDLEQSIASFRKSGIAVEVKPALTVAECDQLRENKNLTELICRP